MNKKIFAKIILFGGLLLCLALGVSAFFFDRDEQIERSGGDELPSFTDSSFAGAFNERLVQQSPFRPAALKLKAEISEKIFGTSSADTVILGSDGWLYFSETTNEYIGEELLTDEEIGQIVDRLNEIYEYCKERNVNFIFTVAPNKNTLYPEHMPKRYLRQDMNNYDRLTAALAETDIPFVDFHDLRDESDELLYYKTDTHWNSRGALAAYNRLMSALNIECETYDGVPFVQKTHLGDLEQMLHPSSYTEETEYAVDYDFTYSYVGRFKSEEDITIRTENVNGSGSLLMFRDSFGSALLPLFAEEFKNACFSRAVPIDLSMIDTENADVVIYEIVQRNIENIIKY